MTGLAGHSAGYTQLVWIVASVLGAVALLVLYVAYRRARAAHDLEEAERVIEQAYAEAEEPPDVA